MQEQLIRNRYRMTEALGRGAGGSVYAVYDEISGRPLALKALFSASDDRTLLDRLRAEFRALAALAHPQLAQVYDFGRLPANSDLPGSEGREGFFFTRDLIEGQTLDRYCLDRALPEICEVFRQVALALDVLHRFGLLHGDFKPANVIVDASGKPHLIDFGLARREGASGLGGTLAYLPPEVVRREKVDRRSDLYSLGIVMFQILGGQLPFDPRSMAEAVQWHTSGEPLSPMAAKVSVPRDLDQLVVTMTQRDPARRPPSAEEVAYALERVIEALGATPAELTPFETIPVIDAVTLLPLRELERLASDRLIRRLNTAPVAVSVSGAVGSGKSTLLREYAWRCQVLGLEFLSTSADPSDARAFGTLTDLFDQLSGLVGRPHPLTAPRASAEPSENLYGAARSLSRYVGQATGDTPVVLAIDQAQHLDPQSIQLLRFVLRTVEPDIRVMFVLVHDDDVEVGQSLGIDRRIALQSVSREQISDLIERMAGRARPEHVEQVASYCDGNLQLAISAIQYLARRGWAKELPHALAQPERFTVHVDDRLRELAPEDQNLLLQIAVYGQAAAETLLATPSGDLVQRLKRLELSGWLRRDAGGRIAFRSGAARNVLYHQAKQDQLMDCHRQAADRLEQAGAPSVEIARHVVLAGELNSRWQTVAHAIDAVRDGFVTERSSEFLGAAFVKLPAGDPRRFAVGMPYAEFMVQHGRLAQARQVLSRLEPQTAEQRSAVRLAQAEAARLGGDLDAVLALTDDASAWHGDDLGRATLCRANALVGLNRHEEALTCLSDSTSAEAHALRGWSLGYLGRFQQAEAAFDKALSGARDSKDDALQATVLSRVATISWRRGDHGSVASQFGRALQAARAAAQVDREAAILTNLGAYHLQRGEYAAARPALSESLQLFEAMGSELSAASVRCNAGQLETELGLYQRAKSYLFVAREIFRRTHQRNGEALATLLLGIAAARQYDFDSARTEIEGAIEIYRELDQRRDLAEALLDYAEFELIAQEPQRCLEHLETVANTVDLSEMADSAVRASVFGVLARLRTASDDDVEQLKAELERAFAKAETLDSPQCLWLCYAAAWELARKLGRTRVAAEQLKRAFEVLSKMAEGLGQAATNAFWADPRRRVFLRAQTSGSDSVLFDDNTWNDEPNESGAFGDTQHSTDMTPERFYRVLEIYHQLNSELEPSRLLELVMHSAVELTGAERGFLLLGEDADDLKVEIARNIDPDGEASSYSRSIAKRVYDTGRPVTTFSAHNDPRFSEYASVHQLKLESVLCMPIHAKRGVIGALYMESRYRSQRFTQADERLLAAFGDQVAIALTNAQLHQENQRKAADLAQANQEIEALAAERGELLKERTEQLQAAKRDLADTRRQLESLPGRFGLVGRSSAMMALFELIERVGRTPVPVLIHGESGTGKEIVARAIHAQSPRAERRMVTVNCGAIPENLLESELFGHERGAFTGADRARKGLFQVADGGTLFLDEIGDTPMKMQVDLLRALQEGTVRPVGGQVELKVDVRIIAASNKSLDDLVRQGTFREDLFYRLHVVLIELPPLRDRSDDIPLLVDHFLTRIAHQMNTDQLRITRAGLRRLVEYPWPGNIRQLENALMTAAVLAEGGVLDEGDFTLESPRKASVAVSRPAAHEDSRDHEKARILEALERFNGNKSKAARHLGIPRRTFYRRLEGYGIQ